MVFDNCPVLATRSWSFEEPAAPKYCSSSLAHSRVQPLWTSVIQITGLCPESKAGEVRFRSKVTTVPLQGRVHLLFPLQTAKYLPCMKLGRSSISTVGSCPPLPPSPLFGPSLKNNALVSNYIIGSTKYKREKKNQTNKPKQTPKHLKFSKP